MIEHRMRNFKAILLLGFILLFFPFSAAAENETVEVHIPVWASHTDCTAEVTDASGNRLQLLDLKRATIGEFVIDCTGLIRHVFSRSSDRQR